MDELVYNSMHQVGLSTSIPMDVDKQHVATGSLNPLREASGFRISVFPVKVFTHVPFESAPLGRRFHVRIPVSGS